MTESGRGDEKEHLEKSPQNSRLNFFINNLVTKSKLWLRYMSVDMWFYMQLAIALV